MLTFTLDTNCVIAVDEGRTEATSILKLADAHRHGKVDVAVVAIMASEKQRSTGNIENFELFKARLDSLALGHLGLTLPLGYWDITFWDKSISGGDSELALDRTIHNILFPELEFNFSLFCQREGVSVDGDSGGRLKNVWRNAKCDVLSIWSHIYSHRSIFVTTDKNFHKQHKKQALLDIGASEILYPSEAALALART